MIDVIQPVISRSLIPDPVIIVFPCYSVAAQPVAHRLAVLDCSLRGGRLHYVFTVFASLPHLDVVDRRFVAAITVTVSW